MRGAKPGSRLSIRTPGLFLRGPRHHARKAGLQSYCGAARHLGQNRETENRNDHPRIGRPEFEDAACAVLKDGESAGRRGRTKRSLASPRRALCRRAAIASALEVARLKPADVNCVALVRPFAQQIHLTLRAQFPNAQMLMVEHHAAHAASAYYPSPFEDATVLTLDRDGDFRSAARWRASGNQLQSGKGSVLSRFARRSVQPRHGIAGIQRRIGRAQSAVAVHRRFRRAVSAAVRRDPGIRRLALLSTAVFFDSDRLSQGGFSEKFYSRLGPGRRRARFPNAAARL